MTTISLKKSTVITLAYTTLMTALILKACHNNLLATRQVYMIKQYVVLFNEIKFCIDSSYCETTTYNIL